MQAYDHCRSVLADQLGVDPSSETVEVYLASLRERIGKGPGDTVAVWGDGDAVRTGIDAHLEAGADHVAIQSLSADPSPHLPVAEWRALAAVLYP